MKAIRLHEYGGPEQLHFEDAPSPEPAAGQVLVRVHAASVNPWDYKLASGAFRDEIPLKLPYIPGGDFSGVVEAAAPDVSGLAIGQAVYGNCPRGAWAQFLAVSDRTIAPKPQTLSHVEAASVPIAGL